MKKFLRLLFHPVLVSAVLLAALFALLWIVGPLVAIGSVRPLATNAARWWTVGAIVGVVLAVWLFRRRRAARRNAAMVKQLDTVLADAPDAAAADLDAVQQRFSTALSTLRRMRFGGGAFAAWFTRLGGRYLYELPWYLIVGAPGSGKTTALRHCGLRFPLAEQGRTDSLAGVGGTRNCEWSFSDRAVLIDTAGRFVSQDSDRDADRKTWFGFLALLRRARPRQPVNGVLVTVAVGDLLSGNPAQRMAYATQVRARLAELHEGLGIRFPIYVLVTKCDLLAGFNEYFATLDNDQRATPWGATLAIDGPPGTATMRLDAELTALQQRLGAGLIDRLQHERDPRRRALIYGFPCQFAAVQAALREFNEEVFAASAFAPESLLRGAYLVSGDRHGPAVDSVFAPIAQAYGLAARALPSPRVLAGSFFLSRLMEEVILAESGIAGTSSRWERRHSFATAGGYALVGVLAIAAVSAWSISYLNNRRYVAEVAGQVEQVRKLVDATPNVASADLQPALPAIVATRRLAQPSRDGDKVPATLGFGLYQGNKLDSAARQAYMRMLDDAVLPRLAMRLDDQLRESGPARESRYEALKAYLMLHDASHFDAAALQNYFEADWDARLAGTLTPAQRTQLSDELEALLAQGGASRIATDPALVESVRTALAAVPLPQRIYNRMRLQGVGSEFPEFTVVNAAGSGASMVLTRASGLPLTQGVPGFFSYNGYYKGFQREVDRVTAQLASEQSWVLGIPDAPSKTPGTALLSDAALGNEVRRIYLTEYAAVWEAFIADIRMVPMAGLAQTVQTARTLSAPDTPLIPLLKAMSRETTLLAPEKTTLDDVRERAADVLKQSREQLVKLMAPRQAEPDRRRIESIVDDRFIALRQQMTPGDGRKAPIDATIALLGDVYVQLSAIETALKAGTTPPPSTLPNRIKTESARLPEPLRSMLDTLSASSALSSQLMMRQILSQDVRSQVSEFCNQAVAGRYPIDRNATRDVTQADFAQLFGPGGKIDHVFQERLAPFVDTSKRPWGFRAIDGTPLGTDAGTLPQFQRAAAIRDTFFPQAASVPTLRLEFKPIEMDAALTQFILDVDGQVVRYAHGPQIPVSVRWPGPRGSQQVRVQVSPPATSGESGMMTEGPWALFRLFDRVKMEPTSDPERFRATFDVDGRKASFEITASGVRNPFRVPELNAFQCPNGL